MSTDNAWQPRVTIVGAGLMGRWHADAAERAGGKVVAIVDANLPRAKALGMRYPGSETFNSLDAAVVKCRVDIVHICTPTVTHLELAASALRGGTHVIVEKPLAPTRGATEELIQLATSRGRLLCPTHQFLFQSGIQQTLRNTRNLGPLVHVEYTTCSAGAEGLDGTGRDGVATEILPHPLSLLARIFPGELSRAQWQTLHPAPGEFRVAAEFGPTSVAIFISMAGRPTRNQIQIIGQKGTATADLYHGFTVIETGTVSRLHKAGRPFLRSGQTFLAASLNLTNRAMHGEVAYPGLRELVRQFYVAAQTGAPPPITADETLEVAAGRDALLRCLQRE